jgi:tetratricopeptide (TPR) repeat protein
MPDDITFTLGWNDIDPALLPQDSREAGTDAFRRAVTGFLKSQYEACGGKTKIVFDDTAKTVAVQWAKTSGFKTVEQQALRALERQEYGQAIPLLRALIAANPKDPTHLYNLGMVFSNQGRLDEAIDILGSALAINPAYTNAMMALGVVHAKAGQLDDAIDSLTKAASLDSKNTLVHLNLGGCFLKRGDFEQAEKHLRLSLELDPTNLQARLGLGQTLESLDHHHEADEIYQAIITAAGHSDIGSLAKEGRTRIAHALLRRAGDERPDVVMYCFGALERFQNLSPQEIGNIGREIAILGMKGLDINDPTTKYTLKSFPGQYSGLHLVSIMYAAFQYTAPGTDVGIDLSNEYAQAVKMFGERE